MRVIDVNTDELHYAAKEIKFITEEMTIAFMAAENALAPCRGHRSKKVENIIEEWDKITFDLKRNLESLFTVSLELEKVEKDFTSVN